VTVGSQIGKGNLRPEMTEDEKKWFQMELKEQLLRYELIVKQMDDLTQEREKWCTDFLERIQSRGFHVHAEQKRLIKKEEIRPRDGRPLQVIY
tara:strand:- start:270 stop:548 length:279 start_codon:yes stop_codon:yes gene_type:complete